MHKTLINSIPNIIYPRYWLLIKPNAIHHHSPNRTKANKKHIFEICVSVYVCRGVFTLVERKIFHRHFYFDVRDDCQSAILHCCMCDNITRQNRTNVIWCDSVGRYPKLIPIELPNDFSICSVCKHRVEENCIIRFANCKHRTLWYRQNVCSK